MAGALKGQQITLKGKDFKDGGFIDSDVNISICDDSSLTGYSKPITQAAKKQMIQPYVDELQNKLNAATAGSQVYNDVLQETVSVDFGKQSLLLILSQADCEGIKFSFAKGINNQLTLVAEGLTLISNIVQPVTIPDITDPTGKIIKNEPMTFEVVPPNTFGEYLTEQNNLDEFHEINKILFI